MVKKWLKKNEKFPFYQGWQKIQNFEKIHGWMDKIGFIWIKYGDFFKNGFFQKYLTNVWGKWPEWLVEWMSDCWHECKKSKGKYRKEIYIEISVNNCK